MNNFKLCCVGVGLCTLPYLVLQLSIQVLTAWELTVNNTAKFMCVCPWEGFVLPSGLDRWMQSVAAPYPGLMLAHKCVQMAAVQQQDHGHKHRYQTQAYTPRFVTSISMACSWQCCQPQDEVSLKSEWFCSEIVLLGISNGGHMTCMPCRRCWTPRDIQWHSLDTMFLVQVLKKKWSNACPLTCSAWMPGLPETMLIEWYRHVVTSWRPYAKYRA